jgi:hypothetical protein
MPPPLEEDDAAELSPAIGLNPAPEEATAADAPVTPGSELPSLGEMLAVRMATAASVASVHEAPRTLRSLVAPSSVRTLSRSR